MAWVDLWMNESGGANYDYWPPVSQSATDTLGTTGADASSTVQALLETIFPDAILTQTNIGGTVSDIAADADGPAGTNIMQAGDTTFETADGASTTHWVGWTNEILNFTTAGSPPQGTQALQESPQSGAAGSLAMGFKLVDAYCPLVTAGVLLTGVVTLKTTEPAGVFEVGLSFRNAANAQLQYTSRQITLASGWQSLSVLGQAPAGTHHVALVALCRTTVTGPTNTMQMDKAGILLGTGTTWVAGTGAYTDPTWMAGTGAVDLRVSFPTPGAALVPGFTQEFRIRIRPGT